MGLTNSQQLFTIRNPPQAIEYSIIASKHLHVILFFTEPYTNFYFFFLPYPFLTAKAHINFTQADFYPAFKTLT
uniref:hypothetical protein n=1 Tax=Mycobacterium tuberculosis TaxID=1773 RepID=UPI0025516897